MGRESPDGRQKLLGFDRLHQAAGDHELTGLHFCRSAPGHYDYRYSRETACAALFQELFAVQPGHHQIQKNKVGPRTGPELFERVQSIGSEMP